MPSYTDPPRYADPYRSPRSRSSSRSDSRSPRPPVNGETTQHIWSTRSAGPRLQIATASSRTPIITAPQPTVNEHPQTTPRRRALAPQTPLSGWALPPLPEWDSTPSSSTSHQQGFIGPSSQTELTGSRDFRAPHRADDVTGFPPPVVPGGYRGSILVPRPVFPAHWGAPINELVYPTTPDAQATVRAPPRPPRPPRPQLFRRPRLFRRPLPSVQESPVQPLPPSESHLNPAASPYAPPLNRAIDPYAPVERPLNPTAPPFVPSSFRVNGVRGPPPPLPPRNPAPAPTLTGYTDGYTNGVLSDGEATNPNTPRLSPQGGLAPAPPVTGARQEYRTPMSYMNGHGPIMLRRGTSAPGTPAGGFNAYVSGEGYGPEPYLNGLNGAGPGSQGSSPGGKGSDAGRSSRWSRYFRNRSD